MFYYRGGGGGADCAFNYSLGVLYGHMGLILGLGGGGGLCYFRLGLLSPGNFVWGGDGSGCSTAWEEREISPFHILGFSFILVAIIY